jgi:hypothetical protein
VVVAEAEAEAAFRIDEEMSRKVRTENLAEECRRQEPMLADPAELNFAGTAVFVNFDVAPAGSPEEDSWWPATMSFRRQSPVQ